ncbi:hypothetical protein V1508DRAFT_429211 [Lipomyces doorenjongii]|uniref:uncharacterized protein n=1 Tax=Lipomyces doorenjongii TaxID=383834 RepID=UPI0034CFE80B
MPDGHGQIYFRVKWEGYANANEDTWEPMWHLSNCPEKIDEFLRTHPDHPALPVKDSDMQPIKTSSRLLTTVPSKRPRRGALAAV